MSTLVKITTPTKSIICLFLLLLTCLQTIRASSEIPLLYLGSHIKKCRAESPENFYRDVAFPALSNLQEEANGFFGILMDKLEASVSDEEEDEKAKLEKKWLYLMETIQNSLESVIERIQKSWAIVVSIYDTEPLPWEISVKHSLTGEFLNEIGYQYAMVDSVVKSGVKEIVGTLQAQLAKVMHKVEKDVSDGTQKEEGVTEIKLLKKIEQSLNTMEVHFVGNLMKKIVKRAMDSRSPEGKTKDPKSLQKDQRTFLTDILEQTAIVLQAYRQKGQLYPKFWREITEIMKEDESLENNDISNFIDYYSSNEEHLIDNIILILTSSHKLT